MENNENQSFSGENIENIATTEKENENSIMQKLKPKKSFALTIFFAVLFGIVIANTFGGYVTGLIAGFFSTLTTFVSALVIIFILKHIMHFIEKTALKHFLVGNKNEFKIKRIISIILAFCFLILLVVLMMSLIVPRVVEIVTELVNNRDTYIYQIKSQLTDFITSVINADADDTVNSIMVSVSSYLEDTFNNFLPKVLEISTNTILFLGQLLLGGVLAFIYLYNRESINNFFAKIFKSKCKTATVNRTYKLMQLSDRVLVDYIIAKILEAIVITVIIGIGLSILGVKYAFELALIIGILNVIPYIGFIIALFPTTLITIIYGSIELAIQTLALTTVLYIFLTTFITPIIVGKKIKVNILLMLSAMILFGGMFGMVGMAIAAPVACIFGEVFKERMAMQENEQKEVATNAPPKTTDNYIEDKQQSLNEEVANEKQENLDEKITSEQNEKLEEVDNVKPIKKKAKTTSKKEKTSKNTTDETNK